MLLDLVPTTSTIAINIPHKSIYIYIYIHKYFAKKIPSTLHRKRNAESLVGFQRFA